MRERRKTFRVQWDSAGKIYDRYGRFAGLCTVSNFSNGGAKLIGLEPSAVPDEFILLISPHCHAQRCHVIRRSNNGLAVEFMSSAKSINELAENWQRKTQKAPLAAEKIVSFHKAKVEVA